LKYLPKVMNVIQLKYGEIIDLQSEHNHWWDNICHKYFEYYG